jgi:fatty acid desaturase
MQQAPDDERNATDVDEHKTELETHRTRRELALIVTGLITVIALVAVFQNGAMPVLDKVLPMVTLAFGFFFGQRAARL